jgi:hypothetical protein
MIAMAMAQQVDLLAIVKKPIQVINANIFRTVRLTVIVMEGSVFQTLELFYPKRNVTVLWANLA